MASDGESVTWEREDDEFDMRATATETWGGTVRELQTEESGGFEGVLG